MYDSAPATYEHIQQVQKLLNRCICSLLQRSENHDQTKLHSPEKEAFDEVTPLLKGSTYGSDEYKANLEKIRPAIDHHNANNSHHPEHYGYLECNGCFKRFPKDFKGYCDVCGYSQMTFRPNMAGMNLLDLLEMLCDWKAATLRHADGDIRRSLEINQERFGYPDFLKEIMLNTLPFLEE